MLKGAHSLFFGPQTIGGVINYLTPDAPTTPGGFVQLSAGSRSYFNAHLQYHNRNTKHGLSQLDTSREPYSEPRRSHLHKEGNSTNYAPRTRCH